MDPLTPRKLEVDLESGVAVNGDDANKVSISSIKSQAWALLANVFGGLVKGWIKDEDKIYLSSNESKSNGVPTSNGEMGIGKMLNGENSGDHIQKKLGKEKHKKTSNKKPSKPPRPPKGPTLDAADLKLIRELTELAMLKRARIERMKALKKLKAAKQSSSSSNIFALVFTIVFCLVILLQGISSGRSSVPSFHRSPAPDGGTEGGLISMQYHYHLNPSSSQPNAPSSESHSFIEQVAGSNPPYKLRRVLG